MRITKAYAKEVVDIHKSNTAYFDGSITRNEFESMLRCMGFGISETVVITMALILAGAKFAD